MAITIKIPETGESISEVILSKWLKSDGDQVKEKESICVLETDKADFELTAPAAGILRTLKKEGDTIQVGEEIASIEGAEGKELSSEEAIQTIKKVEEKEVAVKEEEKVISGEDLSPAVRRLVEEHNLRPETIQGTGHGGRLTKQDVLTFIENQQSEKPVEVDTEPEISAPVRTEEIHADEKHGTISEEEHFGRSVTFERDGTKRIPMSKIRRRIAQRLVNAHQITAMLTTFNEIDLNEVLAIRTRYKERFDKVHGVSLGLMSFFARACVLALNEFPNLNAKIDGDDIVHHQYVHLGIAVSTDRGLVVPVLRNVEKMSFAQIEIEIKRMANAARIGKLSIEELSDGTFSITNGGVFGSLLSTPILNMPQSGILGMHAIKKRPVAVNDEIVIHPMMYVALTYDHRIVDGRESVSFLVRIKELLEDPARLMLEI